MFDLSSLLGAMGMQQNAAQPQQMGGFQMGGMGNQMLDPSGQATGGAVAPQAGQQQPGGWAQGLMHSGMLGPLSAAAGMLQASGPSRMPTGFGQAAGAGLQGLIGGAQADQAMANQQQQQNALGRIADRLGQAGSPQGQMPHPQFPGMQGQMPGQPPQMPGAQPQMQQGAQAPQLPSGMQMPQGAMSGQGAMGGQPNLAQVLNNPQLMAMLRQRGGMTA